MKYFYDTEFLEGQQTNRFLGIPIGKTKPTIDLISIGIVAEDNREYYAVSKDFNLKEAWNRYDEKVIPTYGDMRNHFPEGKKVKEYWIRENVLKNIFDSWILENNAEIIRLGLPMSICEDEFNLKNFTKWLRIKGVSNSQIKTDLINFLQPVVPNLSDGEIECKYQMTEGSYHYFNCTSPIGNFSTTRYIDKPILYGYYSDYDHVVLCWLFGKMKDLPEFMPKFTLDVNQLKKDIQKSTPINLEDYGGYPKNKNCHNALEDAKWTKKLFEFLYVDNDIKSNDTRRKGKSTRTIDFAIQVLFSRGEIIVPPVRIIDDFLKEGLRGSIKCIIDHDFDKHHRVQKYLLDDILKRLSLEHSITINSGYLDVDFQKGIIRLVNFKKQ